MAAGHRGLGARGGILNLGKILREIFTPAGKGDYNARLRDIREEERRLNRCIVILEGRTEKSIREASEEAASFNGES